MRTTECLNVTKRSQSFIISLQFFIHLISHNFKLFRSDISHKAVKTVSPTASGGAV